MDDVWEPSPPVGDPKREAYVTYLLAKDKTNKEDADAHLNSAREASEARRSRLVKLHEESIKASHDNEAAEGGRAIARAGSPNIDVATDDSGVEDLTMYSRK